MIDLSSSALAAAFGAGVVSFLSPCVLPLVPGYVSYIAGQSVTERAGAGGVVLRLQVASLGVCFVLGFSTIFVLLGASATALGQLLLAYHRELNFVAGATVIGFGLFTLGIVRPAWLHRDFRFQVSASGGGPIAAYGLGMAFAFGWTPCIGPILGAILTVSAASATIGNGVVLLTTYSVGLGVPFVLAALFTDVLFERLRSIGYLGRVLQILAGGIMIIMGIAMITGALPVFAIWLLEAFPALGSIG